LVGVDGGQDVNIGNDVTRFYCCYYHFQFLHTTSADGARAGGVVAAAIHASSIAGGHHRLVARMRSD
jgi:hypothetical protein